MVIAVCIQDDAKESRRKRRRHTLLCMSRSIPTQTTKAGLECEPESDNAQLLQLYTGGHAALELEFAGHECLLT